MWEVWTECKRWEPKIWLPVAYFNQEEDARDYADLLSSKEIPVEVMYNETAYFGDYYDFTEAGHNLFEKNMREKIKKEAQAAAKENA